MLPNILICLTIGKSMRQLFIIVFLSGFMVLGQTVSQASSIPKEVMEPYRAYKVIPPFLVGVLPTHKFMR